MEIYDSLIIGAGPAGLSTAIYLSRFNRSVLVIDMGYGRSTSPEINENYLGFPEGIHAKDLRELGRKQAEKFGAEFIIDEIINVSKKQNFELISKKNVYQGKTLIFATGVTDLFPKFEHMRE
ncbi:MAG TPA: NAD(P)/FAD-dependent oxidoreductase, partial [Candidatus Nitrosocosmicus sp.]|nr:NAD(P)/FAD-dependent oxidoreductase [Candidatus Nitrosocosmicus sp.]